MADCSARVKQSTAANFKANINTDKGKSDLRSFLDGLLKLQEPFDKHKKEWSSFLIAGGKTPEEFKNTVRSYDSPTICGLVWNRNFVAYRCRDCGISPCMSLCADCFHAGNHEGHDFNMFKSQAGGACDCGDESVMKKEGFCSRHGIKENNTPPCRPPDHLFAMARTVLPRLCMRLHYQLEQVDNESLDTNSPLMEDANGLSEFLITICDTDNMKNVMAECLMVEMRNVEPSNKLRPMSFNTTVSPQTSSRSSMMPKTQGTTITRKESSSSFSSSSSYDSLDEDHRTYLNFMMDFVTKYEFPQRLVTFLLHLLPCKEYKESFTKVFCQHYQMIARALVSSDGPSVEQLSNRVVHVSVQLFSNKELAEKMVLEQNLLHVMVKVLHDMVRPALKEVKGGDQLLSYQLVVNCDNRALSHHCYWPIVSDFINILSHKTVAEMFMKNHDLIKQWMTFIQYLTGMNTTYRQVMSHIEFEPTVYFTSFSVELEAASSPLWSFISGCRVLDSSVCLKNMIVGSTEALWKWYKHIDSMPRHGEVTFHLPLHRYLAGFLSVATSHFKMPLHGIIPNHDLLRLMVEHLLQTQAAVCEIRAGRWVRNGAQIRSQVRLYEECQFCNSMVDLDIFMLQVCATFLDPDCFLNAVLERFGIQHWFQFGESAVPTPPCFDAETDITMVEGVLNLIITLLSFRQHLGMNSKEIIRKEMVAQLCMSDRTHSQLVDLIPDKPGQSHKVQDFETILAELADYKAPGFECGWMQQGMYTPKDEVWENEFDFTHVVHRAIQRQDIQSAMSRYCTL